MENCGHRARLSEAPPNLQSAAPIDAKFCALRSWLLDENNDVPIDNIHILVLLHPFDRTADVTEKNRNKIMHLKCKKIAPRKYKIIIAFSAPEWPRLAATAIQAPAKEKLLFLFLSAFKLLDTPHTTHTLLSLVVLCFYSFAGRS